MVIFCTGGLDATEAALTIIFYGANFSFIVGTVVILRKVKWVFSQIMQ